ncbi:hypothetical protein JCGZ_02620 [Jatropha curcas]|uniref:Uncharacterized protein n=2 Tax=Jatropha curcas TaxID=180498 RepID=A0A067L521_JATCU|nr:disease resistance protein RGA2 isoform X2 [Jatropha curcas]KDP39600.1 hypothetical protein JCGZ_02620 [Jatropha curcas]
MASLAFLVVSPVVNEIVKVASSLIKEEFLLLWGVKDDIVKLSSNLTAIQATLNDAEERQLDEEHLRDWLGKLKDAADDAEDLLDIFAAEIFLWKKKHEKRRIPTPISASKICIQSDTAHKIKELSARLDIIAEERQRFHLNINVNGRMSQSHDRPPTDYFVDTKNVFGREDDKERIIDLLDNSDEEGDLSVMPIIGMGGLGKTTLAQLVYNDERVKERFELSRMWVSVSIDFNLTRILRGIMESYSKMALPADLSPNLILSRFRDFLPGKKFLLVLDDVWNDNYSDWEPLLELLKLGNKGSKVLVTSRSRKVADIVGTCPPYLLEYLPENECWSLFERIAFKKGDLPYPRKKDLEDIGREIVAKCKGLPLAVKTMGGLLRGNTELQYWRRILRSNTWELEDQNILPALKLSYNHLPSHLKQCFAFCSVFPKAYAFDKKELVKLWMAQSFVQPIEQNNTEEIGSEYFDFLLTRSFFQLLNINNSVKYRMHDLIHDLALSISGPQYYQIKDNNLDFQPENSRNWRHVSLLCQNVEEPSMKIANHSKKLRTLLLPREHLTNFGQALDKLFHSMRYIRALDLSSTTITELPSSIEECKLLRYLDLSQTQIKELPNSICSLYNLQTLKLLGCLCLFELPKDLGDLVNLCHLELDDMFWFKCTTLPANLGNLKGLRNLHKFKVGNQTGYAIRELKEMVYLTGELHISNLEVAVDATDAKLNEKERLQKVVFEWTRRDVNSQDEAAEEMVLRDLQPHSDLKELVISNYGGARFPSWMTEGQLRNLVSISLFNCTKCKILSLGGLPNLRSLYIKEMQNLDILQCPSLRGLKISSCSRLSEIPEFLPNLTVLKIKRCASLKALPVTPSLMFLILVDNLVLEDWQEVILRRITRNNQGEFVSQPYPSLIGLLEMKVINCPKLQALPQAFSPQKLEISGCELLTALPPSRFAQRLQHLALDRSNNGVLLRAIPDTNSLYSLVISNVANVVSLPKLPNLPGLKALYIHNCEDLESLSEEEGSFQSLSSLRLLSIQGCQKLGTLPNEGLPTLLECLSVGSCHSLQSLGNKGTLKSLISLQDLYIEDCPLLQSFPEDGLPTSLQHLYIQKCPQLTEGCKKDVGPEWTKIENIPDLEIDLIQVRSTPQLPKKKPWYYHFVCGKGLNSQIEMELGESSTPPENSTYSFQP